MYPGSDFFPSAPPEAPATPMQSGASTGRGVATA